MARNVKLLLVESVDSLGIVGDVVNVRTGYARNFLLPRSLATLPSDELVASLGAKRAEAEKHIAEQRSQREKTVEKLRGLELELVRSCNDQGILYGAITQQDIAAALAEKGYHVKPREVRLPGSIKRVDHYEFHVKLDSDLDALVKLNVKADRELDSHKEEPAAAAGGIARRDAMADLEAADKARVVGWGGDKKDSAGGGEHKGEGKKSKKDRQDAAKDGDAKGEKPAKAEKPDKEDKKGDKKGKDKK